MRRICTIMAVALASAASVLVLLWGLSFTLSPHAQFISVSDGLCLSLGGGRIYAFNRADYGPYTGSILVVADEGTPNPLLGRSGVTRPGVYYRWFAFRDGSTLWTLAFSLLIPALLCSLPAVAWWLGQKRKPTGGSVR